MGNDVASTTVTPTTNDDGATVTVAGTPVTSGEASGANNLNVGPNVISIRVTAQDGTTMKTYTVVVIRAPVAPTIALAVDTGADTSDGITRNGRVDVNNLAPSATWTYSIKGTTTTITDTTITSFTLAEGEYNAGEIQVVQTISDTDSAPAILGAVTIDTTAPTITLSAGSRTTLTAGDIYTEEAIVEDNLDISIMLIVGGHTVDTNTPGTYTITYDATDAAGNQAFRGGRTITVEPLPISSLDGDESTVSINDAKFLYYAYALDPAPEESADIARILGPLTSIEDSKLGNILTAAKNILTDLNENETIDAEDAAAFYYSFALEASLGDGSNAKPGILAIKKVILGPLALTDDMNTINTMLQQIYILRGGSISPLK